MNFLFDTIRVFHKSPSWIISLLIDFWGILELQMRELKMLLVAFWDEFALDPYNPPSRTFKSQRREKWSNDDWEIFPGKTGSSTELLSKKHLKSLREIKNSSESQKWSVKTEF